MRTRRMSRKLIPRADFSEVATSSSMAEEWGGMLEEAL